MKMNENQLLIYIISLNQDDFEDQVSPDELFHGEVPQ